MKVKQMFKQKMFFRQPTGCIPWQHTPEVLCGKLLNLEVTVGVAASTSKCSQILSAQNDRSHGANAYHFQSDWPTVAPPRRQRVICLTPQGHLSTTGSETFPGTTSRQLNLFFMMMLNTSLDPKPNEINGPQCKIWRTWPWLCSFNTSSATFPVQWDSSFCGRTAEKYWRWRHPSESV